jgi:Glycosyl-transferase for dystroglycan
LGSGWFLPRQGCTDYDRWRTAKAPYGIEYCKRYEPWGIAARALTPWFDGRFRGYGRNKIMYAAALNSTGFSFVVDPQVGVQSKSTRTHGPADG